jgi:glycosyltransferase involved in cell wall biosynthesis
LKLALLVATYDRPDALACVLQSVERQTELPDEVIIADDGSAPPTRTVVDAFRQRFPREVHHTWHRHEGPRVGRARNVGIAQASGDYIVQIDGDMVLHPEFIGDHRRAARPGFWVQGTRILLDTTRTRELIAGGPRTFGFFSAGLGFKRRAYTLRWPGSAALLPHAANAFVAIKGCNQGFWRADLERVNGYNEDMTGWGSEDKELAVRLTHAGVRHSTLLFGGIAYHLHHPPAPRDRRAVNEAILRETLRQRTVRCATGLDAHRPQLASTAVR